MLLDFLRRRIFALFDERQNRFGRTDCELTSPASPSSRRTLCHRRMIPATLPTGCLRSEGIADALEHVVNACERFLMLLSLAQKLLNSSDYVHGRSGPWHRGP
jgi:hypothetical protein